MHERPFGRGGVPVQLAHRPRLEPHRDAGDSFGDRQLLDRGLLAVAAADHLAFGGFQLEFERRQFLAGQQIVGNVVHETGVAPSACDCVVSAAAVPAARPMAPAMNSRRWKSDMVGLLVASGGAAKRSRLPSEGVEPATLGSEDRCSIQLSYDGASCKKPRYRKGAKARSPAKAGAEQRCHADRRDFQLAISPNQLTLVPGKIPAPLAAIVTRPVPAMM